MTDTGQEARADMLQGLLTDREEKLAILDKEVRELRCDIEALRADHERTKAAAWDWQERAQRAEGHLRFLDSFFGRIVMPGTEERVVDLAKWEPGDLEAMICRILTAQQEEAT